MTKTVLERLSDAHGRDLKAAIEGAYDSDPLFGDAKTEIEQLREELSTAYNWLGPPEHAGRALREYLERIKPLCTADEKPVAAPPVVGHVTAEPSDSYSAEGSGPAAGGADQPWPTAWMRGVTSYCGANEPPEHDAEFSYGDDKPEGDGWVPLYRAAERSGLKSRDEIIELMKGRIFSRRNRFYGLLSRYATREVQYPGGPKSQAFAWPDVLSVITLEEWNAAYEAARTHPLP